MAPTADVLSPVDLFASSTRAYYSQGLRARFQLDALKLPGLHNAEPSTKTYASIGYDVDKQAFEERTQASLTRNDREREVPRGWPAQLHGPLIWTSDTFQDESEYVYQLTEKDKEEVLAALAYFKDLGLDGSTVSPDTFPLPALGQRLSEICHDIYEGRGFSIVRGLDPDAYDVEDLTIIYLGISSYIGEKRGKQDQRGSMLMHVIRRNASDEEYCEDKPFHTDTVTDCLCLFTQGLAAIGGTSILASSWTVYNELAATRPDLLHVLARPDWPFDTFGRSPPYYKRAVAYYEADKLIFSFSRRLLVGHPPRNARTPGIPGLSELQAEAIDAMHFIAKKHEIKPRMLKGDLRFINNMAVMHRREAFANCDNNTRHLVRIWLNNQAMCWKLPRDLRVAWARIFEDEDREEHWDIEPLMKDGKILRVAGSCD